MSLPRLPNQTRTSCVTAGALAAVLLMSNPALADPMYDRGREHWLHARYPPAVDTLLTYRNAVNAKKPGVDYMLGTSGCRVPPKRQWGGNVLKFILYRYQLTSRSRQIIESELNLCRAASAMPALGTEGVQVAVVGLAGATSRGKAGYWVNDREPVAAFPARSLGALDEAAIARRLVPVGEPDRIKAELAAVAPSGARIVVLGRYAFVTTAGQSDAQLAGIRSKLDRYLGFLQSEYGLRLPDNYLTLYLVGQQRRLTDLARRLHQLEVSPATIGYTFQDDQSAVAVIPGTTIGTLYHELFHMVVRTSFGDIPQWLDEGLASLYEVSRFEGSRVVGLPNWRGPVLRGLWQDRPPLTDVLGAAWFANDVPEPGPESMEPEPMPSRELTNRIAGQFATARYFMLYLQQSGKLADVYRAVQKLQPGDNDDPAAAVREAVIAQVGPLDAVQANFDDWFVRTEGSRPPEPLDRPITKD